MEWILARWLESHCFYRSKSIKSEVGGLIGTATAEKNGLISHRQVKDSLQLSALSNDIVYKIASFSSKIYTAIVLRGIDAAHGEVMEIFIYKPSDGKLHAKGNSPRWLTLKADSNQNVYASAVTGIAFSYRLESLDLGSAAIGITRVDTFPSDSIDIPFT